MISDPTSYKWDGTTAISFPRTGAGSNRGEFRAFDFSGPAGTPTDGLLTIQHQYLAKRTRRTVRMDQSFYAAQVLDPSLQSFHSMSAYLVLDTPASGTIGSVELGLGKGLIDWLSSSTYANLTKVIGGEI